jgi:hypothetical protein
MQEMEHMTNESIRGVVHNGQIVLNPSQSPLREGTEVLVTPLPAAQKYPVTPTQREALLSLIGIWKMENPPTDDEVEQIIEEERLKKYS